MVFKDSSPLSSRNIREIVKLLEENPSMGISDPRRYHESIFLLRHLADELENQQKKNIDPIRVSYVLEKAVEIFYTFFSG